MDDATVLVLGAGGKLGTMLRQIWATRQPSDLTLQYQSRKPLAGGCSHQWSPGQSPDSLPRCDAVIALWGQTTGDAPTLALNTALAGESRAVALACGASRLLHLSSAAVYGPVEDATEDTPPAPRTAYGLAKLGMEIRIASFDDPDLHHCCLRLANVVGAESLAQGICNNAPVTLDRFPDGNGPLRSYIGADDLADALCELARFPARSLPRILNIAAPRAIAMQDLVRAADKDLIWRDAPETAIQRVTLNTARMTTLLPDLIPTSDADTLIQRWQHHRSDG